MSKNIRQKIAHAIQTTFRSSPLRKQASSTKSKIASCCSVKKPLDYEYLSYQPKPTSSHSDYIDLSECHSWSQSQSTDSGVSFDSNVSSITSDSESFRQLQSTRICLDDASSLSTLSHLSYIPHDQLNISEFDVSAWHPVPTTFVCCHCQCKHSVGDNVPHRQTNPHLLYQEQYLERRSKKEIYPFIF